MYMGFVGLSGRAQSTAQQKLMVIVGFGGAILQTQLHWCLDTRHKTAPRKTLATGVTAEHRNKSNLRSFTDP